VPDRSRSDRLTEEFNLRPYLTDITILPASPFIGKTLREIGMGKDLDLTVLRLTRGRETVMAPGADFRLKEGDMLIVEGQAQEIYKIQSTKHLDVIGNPRLSDTDLQTDDFRLAEVLILPRSPIIGGTLLDMRLREQHNIQVLAINRHEETIHRKIAAIPLRMGDVLLVQGRSSDLAAMERNNTFRIMGTLDFRLPNVRRARLAVGIFAGSLLVASLGWLPVTVALLVGVVLVFLTRCITPEEAYRDVEWKALILITGMLAFGTAMETTGTARFLADQIVRLFGNAQPVWLLTGFFVLTVGLTQPMSNQAAAVVVLPVAIQAALQLDLNPRTFSVMIAIAASTSFITPLEPSCLLVYGLGRYRFSDFIKVGSLLTIFIYILAIIMVPMIWPI
jgi:di/tricarboxylate transporter